MDNAVDLLTLLRDVKEGLSDLFPDRVWVRAEIASIQARSSGHCYLELVQSEHGVQKAKVRAVIWASRYHYIAQSFRNVTGSPLAPGQQLLVLAQVNFSELYSLSLVIDDINPEYTLGDAERRRRETVERLGREGLLDRQKSLSIPPLPYRLAVISAGDAAGYGDFTRHISGNAYGFRFRVDLFPATMQGEGAPASVAGALAAVASSAFPYDAALVMRGGGSALDLACFDDYTLAKAIALCPVPVFTAIGHDRDYHVADMVAFRFFKTPTALADEFIAMYADEDARLEALGNRVLRAVSSRLASAEEKLRSMEGRLGFVARARISTELAMLDSAERRLLAADPAKVLARGYTLVTLPDGTLVRSVSGLKAGDELRIVFADGEAAVKITRN